MINYSWCDLFTRPRLPHNQMPTYLPPKIIIFGYSHNHVYSPQADTTTTLKELHWTLCQLETTYPEAEFIVALDFNKTNLKKMLPKFY